MDINTNALSDASILTQFPNLISLNLSKNQITSLESFNTEHLGGLQILNLSTNKVKILADIKLPHLRRLNLTEN